ncbi:MAG: phosphoenolpyruvate--protein phosphotransferase [Candidatus Hydrogenedentes bacterium]|nr:phosphoenolpyruvate--protein phosphotransferase [Candidatus Hydrogenedentota bacterium]
MEIALRGIGVSPGIAIGHALTFNVQNLDVPKYHVEDSAAELARFDRAIAAVHRDLKRIYDQTARELGAHHAAIIQTHIIMATDMTLRQDIQDRLEAEKVNVEYVVDDLIAKYSTIIENTDDPQFRERTSDLLDVGTRILSKLLNTELDSLARLEHPCVIVSHDLTPSDTANIDTVNALGIATDVSGPTSHTAILARALEIPAVVGLKYVGTHTLPGDMIVVDGTTGYVYIRPSENTLTKYAKEKSRQEEERRALLLVERDTPSQTTDGHVIPTLANIELPVELPHCRKAGAQGVGLYRTEYLFLNRSALPTEEEQYQAYAQVAASMESLPVTIRTLDIGGDKFAHFMSGPKEANPQLGWRAIRFCLERPDIFKAQLRALLRASIKGNIQIMFPMISGIEELDRAKVVLNEVRADLERRSIPFKKDIKLGSMIEVPAAISIADLLAKECDFFSIGTNDLIQYSLAVDRVNERIAHMYEPAHPGVLRMIQHAVRAAKAAKIPCSICGEMAGDPLFTELLLGLGVDSLSMSAVGLPVVRAEIASTSLTQAKRLAKRVLGMRTGEDVRRMLTQRYRGRRAMEIYLSHIENRPPAQAT